MSNESFFFTSMVRKDKCHVPPARRTPFTEGIQSFHVPGETHRNKYTEEEGIIRQHVVRLPAGMTKQIVFFLFFWKHLRCSGLCILHIRCAYCG